MSAETLRVAFLSSEVAPWAKTGGLGDVAGALPQALHDLGGVEVATFCPLYKQVRVYANRKGKLLEDTGVSITDTTQRRTGRWFVYRAEGAPPAYFLDCPEYFDREELYAAYTDAGDTPDNGRRFAFFCQATLRAVSVLMEGAPDIVHAHDWQAAPALLYLKGAEGALLPGARTVLTIHNLAYQGVFPSAEAARIGLAGFPDLEMPGLPAVNLLRAGIAAADAVTTVSPRYAQEIQTPEFGAGLHDWIRARPAGVTGILNGIDLEEWNPETDLALPATYGADHLSGKATCRRHLLAELGLDPETEDLVVGVVSRFVGQKGLDLVADLVPRLHGLGVRLVVLGTGEAGLEARFKELARVYSENLAARIEFSVPMSHRITAGVDAFLVPSRFEPCGLTQMYAMRYGTVPIVHAVGGLADTVTDPGDAGLAQGEGTGFQFHRPDTGALAAALARAARMFRLDPDGWTALMRTGMSQELGWTRSAEAYRDLYRELAQG